MRGRWLVGMVMGCVFTSGAARAQTAARRLTLVEERRIDGATEDLSGQAPNLWVGNDGRVALMNAPEAQFVFFARSGNRLGTFGRKGEGPGEFTPVIANLFSLQHGALGDTMWVYSSEQRRFTLIAPDLKLARTERGRMSGPSKPTPTAS